MITQQPKILYDEETDYLLNTNIKPDNQYRQDYDEEQSFASKTGDFFKSVLSVPEKLDKAIGIHGTRQKAIQALTGGLSEDHMVAALAGEMLVPDSIDLITLGLGYLPRRVLGGGSKAVKMYLKAKKAKMPKSILDAARKTGEGTKRISDADYDLMVKGADKVGRITGKSTDDVLMEQGLLSKMNFQDLDEAENALLNDTALDLLKKQRDAGKGSDVNAMKDAHQDLLKANSQIMGDGSNYIPTLKDKNISEEANAVFSRAAFKNGVFNFENWFKSKDRRITEFFGSVGKRYSRKNYQRVKDLLQPVMEREFANFFQKYNIPGHKIELHHIVPLNIGAQLFDGLRWQSDEWYDLMEVFYKKGVFPGANQVTGTVAEQLATGNLVSVLKEPHYILHQKYFRDVLGTFNPAKSQDPYAHFTKFFTPERIAKIKSGETGRKAVAGEFADRMKEGEKLVKFMMRQIQQSFGKTPLSSDAVQNFDELTELFWKFDQEGMIPALTSKISGKSYASKAVNDQIADIASDMIQAQRLRNNTVVFKVRMSKPQEEVFYKPMFARFSRDMMYSKLTPRQMKTKYKGDYGQMEILYKRFDTEGLFDNIKDMPEP